VIKVVVIKSIANNTGIIHSIIFVFALVYCMSGRTLIR
jgi:hypothetical protein